MEVAYHLNQFKILLTQFIYGRLQVLDAVHHLYDEFCFLKHGMQVVMLK